MGHLTTMCIVLTMKSIALWENVIGCKAKCGKEENDHLHNAMEVECIDIFWGSGDELSCFKNRHNNPRYKCY